MTKHLVVAVNYIGRLSVDSDGDITVFTEDKNYPAVDLMAVIGGLETEIGISIEIHGNTLQAILWPEGMSDDPTIIPLIEDLRAFKKAWQA